MDNISLSPKDEAFNKKYTIMAMSILFSLASIELIINQRFLHYIGNNYIPPGAISSGCSLVISYAAIKYMLPSYQYCKQLFESILLLYLTFIAIAYLTNACQYTPFPPIDKKIIEFERNISDFFPDYLFFSAKHPLLQTLLNYAYNSLSYQMYILPLFMAFCLKKEKIHEYCFYLICTAIIGFNIYYFFPTTAPASLLGTDLFMPEQQATGIKFLEIHTYHIPSTSAGGLISFPSFHVIWAWLCIKLIKEWRFLYFFILPLNMVLISACVLLGWHYLTDLGGSVIVLLLTNAIYKYCKM